MFLKYLLGHEVSHLIFKIFSLLLFNWLFHHPTDIAFFRPLRVVLHPVLLNMKVRLVKHIDLCL